jgi:hypothetical protein
LPPEISNRLREIRRNYFAWHGFEGAQRRLNNRTVAQILAEYEPLDVKPVASGEVDGVRYELYDPAPPEMVDDSQPSEDRDL